MAAAVSVIIPTFNRADRIGDAIRSVIDQTYVDWELVVVDDGSEDHTNEVVGGYRDSRIRYLYQDNAGTSAARNAGLQATGGSYVAFLDSDDMFLPGKLQLQVGVLDRSPALGLVASGWTDVDSFKRPMRSVRPWLLYPGLELSDWLYGCSMIPSAFLVRRQWLVDIGLFDERLRYVEDWDLWLRLAYAGCKMAWEPGLVCLRTVHGESKIHHIEAMNAGLFAMLDKFFKQPDLSEAIASQRELVYARAHVDGMIRAFGAGMVADGERQMQAAVELNPALLDGEPPAIIQSVASSALTDQVPDAHQYVADVSRSLGVVLPQLGYSPRRLWAAIYATEAFDNLANGLRLRARLKAAQALLSDLGWRRNRGLLGILLRP